MNEIEILKNENKYLNTLVQICDEREYEDKEEIVGLKAQLEESRKIEDILKREIKEKNQEHEKLEEEVVSLRTKSEKAQIELTMNIPQIKSSG